MIINEILNLSVQVGNGTVVDLRFIVTTKGSNCIIFLPSESQSDSSFALVSLSVLSRIGLPASIGRAMAIKPMTIISGDRTFEQSFGQLLNQQYQSCQYYLLIWIIA